MEKIFCHDCGKELGHNEEFMSYEAGSQSFAKCKTCHQKDSALRNFQRAEVYSRVVGYIRPVAQWNAGKKEEFSDRAEFCLNDSACC
jgi:anaerobic ribonucleoside-triphosphate reductase